MLVLEVLVAVLSAAMAENDSGMFKRALVLRMFDCVGKLIAFELSLERCRKMKQRLARHSRTDCVCEW